MSEFQIPINFDQTIPLSVDQLWNMATGELFRILREDRRVERKPAMIRPKELAEYLSMWANTATEGGLIAVGVADDGKLLGCLGVETAHTNRLESESCNYCPQAQVAVRRVLIRRDSDGADDFVLLFRVQYREDRVVHTSDGNAYIRRGETKHKLRNDEIRDLQNDKGEVRVEKELYPTYTYPDDFDQPLLRAFLQRVKDSAVHELTDPSDIGLLKARRLGAIKDGKFIPNGACVLLFANDPLEAFPGARVHFLRFEGEKEGTGRDWNAVRDTFIEGPIPHVIEGAAEALSQQLRTFQRLGPDGRFTPTAEYPRDAWYEAVVNACCHRSYGTLKNRPIFVKMFDNRIEVDSPGPFPPSVTAENIYTMHSPRNPILMDGLWMLDLVRCVNEGTKRMRRLMDESELPPPDFAERSGDYSTVRVTLRNNIKQRRAWVDAAVTVISPEIDKTLTEDERRVFNYLAEHGNINTSQAARLLDRGWQSAHRLLLKLQTRKLLKYHHRTDIARDGQAFFTLVPPKRKPDGPTA